MARILLVEDEANVSSFIRKGLEEDGYTVEVAFDGALGLSMASHKEYDLMILDIILPQVNGLEVCRRIRQQLGYGIPILLLTALGTTAEIVAGLESGADDYLVKPFRFRELLARVHALLRRRDYGAITKTLSFADLVMDTETKSVMRAGRQLQLTTKEFRLLELFLSNPRRVLSRSTLLEQVWDIDFDTGTNLVEVYIKYLRDKIDKGFDQKLIHTVVGMGYVLKEG